MSEPRNLSSAEDSSDVIRTRSCPECYLCHRRGELLYENLIDRLFEAPGKWSFRRCPNPECGMVWPDPMPLETEIGKAYCRYSTHEPAVRPQDGFARRLYFRIQMSYVRTKYHYGSSAGDGFFTLLAYLNPMRRANFDLSVFYLESKPHGRLLELGCGNGAMLSSMEELGWQAEGVDFDPAAVDKARLRGVTVHLGTLADQAFPDETFDAIAACHFIEHISDPLGTLRECRRILKPGGRLVLLTPNAGSWAHRVYQADWRGLEPPRHLGIFTPSAMAKITRQAGFDLNVCRSTVRASSIVLESRMLRRGAKTESTHNFPWTLRLWEEVRSLTQWAGTFVDPMAGEEVLLIAAK